MDCVQRRQSGGVSGVVASLVTMQMILHVCCSDVAGVDAPPSGARRPHISRLSAIPYDTTASNSTIVTGTTTTVQTGADMEVLHLQRIDNKLVLFALASLHFAYNATLLPSDVARLGVKSSLLSLSRSVPLHAGYSTRVVLVRCTNCGTLYRLYNNAKNRACRCPDKARWVLLREGTGEVLISVGDIRVMEER